MRSCPRSDELREAIAAEDGLSPSLAAHVAVCADCAGIWATGRRFESRLDTAVAELVTDALPPTTVAAARTAPSAPGRRPAVGLFINAVATAALVAFAVVGIVATGGSVSDAVRGRSGAGEAPAASHVGRVDCYLGKPTVTVDVERIGASAPDAVTAYCFGAVEGASVDGLSAVTCVRSLPVGQAGRGEADAEGSAYLGACTRVVDVSNVNTPADQTTIGPLPSAPFGSWDEAEAAVVWRVLRPGWLPDGYELVALQGFAPPT